MSFHAGQLDRLRREIDEALVRDRNHDNPLNAPMSERAFQTFVLNKLQSIAGVLIDLHRSR